MRKLSEVWVLDDRVMDQARGELEGFGASDSALPEITRKAEQIRKQRERGAAGGESVDIAKRWRLGQGGGSDDAELCSTNISASSRNSVSFVHARAQELRDARDQT